MILKFAVQMDINSSLPEQNWSGKCESRWQPLVKGQVWEQAWCLGTERRKKTRAPGDQLSGWGTLQGVRVLSHRLSAAGGSLARNTLCKLKIF